MKRGICVLLAVLMMLSAVSGCAANTIEMEEHTVPLEDLPEDHGQEPETAAAPVELEAEPAGELAEAPAPETKEEAPVSEVTEAPTAPAEEVPAEPEAVEENEVETVSNSLDGPATVSLEPADEPEKITVTLDPNGGVFPNEFDQRKGCIEVEMEKGGKLTFADAAARAPQREGYKFLGWFAEDGQKVEVNGQVPEGVTRLYAHWERSILLHVINGNFGGSWKGATDIAKEATIEVTLVGEILPSEVSSIQPTRTHGTFDGWYTKAPTEEQKSENGYSYWTTVSKNGQKVKPGDPVPAGVTTLYAVFDDAGNVGESDKLVTYKLNWNGMFGKTASLICSRKYSSSAEGYEIDAEDMLVSGLNWDGTDNLNLKTQSELTSYWVGHPVEGYTFKGWAKDKTAASGDVSVGDVVANGSILYAVWEKGTESNVTFWQKPSPTPAVLDGVRIMGVTSKLDTANTGKVHGTENASFALELFCTPVEAKVESVTWTLEVRKGGSDEDDLSFVFKKPETLTVKADGVASTEDGGIKAEAKGLTLTLTSKGDTSYGVTVSAQAAGSNGRTVSCNAPATVNFYHDWNNWKVTKAATAKAEGIETRSCTLCSTTETRPIAKLPAPATSASDATSAPESTAIPSAPELRYVTIHCPGATFEGYDTFTVTLTSDGKLPKGFDWYQPVRAGYRFLGWFESESSTQEYKMGDSVPANVNDLYAHWVGVVILDAEPGNFWETGKQEDNNYTRTVDLVDGKLPDLSAYVPVYDIAAEKQSVEFQGWFTEKSKVTTTGKDGYSEWSIAPSGDHVQTGDDIKPGTTLYAGYEGASKNPAKVVTYKLNWNGMHGKTGSLICSRRYSDADKGYRVQAGDLAVSGLNWNGENNVKFNTWEDLENYWKDNTFDGYTFKGWATTADAETPNVKAGETVIHDGDVLYAVWEKGSEDSGTSKPVETTPGPLDLLQILGDLNTAKEGSAHAKEGATFGLSLYATPVGAVTNDVTWTLEVIKGGDVEKDPSILAAEPVVAEVKAGETVTAEGTGIQAKAEGLALTITCTDGNVYGVTVSARATGSDGKVISSNADAVISFYHSWGQWKVTKEATTTELGTQTRTCTGCDKTESKSIDKLPATPEPTATVKPAAPATKAPSVETAKPVENVPQAAPGVPEGPGIEEPVTPVDPTEAPAPVAPAPAAPVTEAPAAEAPAEAAPAAPETASQESAPAAIVNKTLDTPAISKVTNAGNAVKITWDKVSGAAQYRVYYKTGSGSWKKLADTADTSYTWTNPEGSTTYKFTVRCLSEDGKSFTSGYNAAGTSITTPKMLDAPKITKVAKASTGVKITWGKVSGAAKYRVYYKTGSGSWKKLADTTSTSYTWKGAKSGVDYMFTVRCLSANGKSFTSGYDSTGTGLASASKTLATPKITKVAKVSTGVKITWGKVSGAAKYRVYYKTGSGGWKKLADTTSTSYIWKAAKSGTAYKFTVRCLSADGKSFTSGYDTAGTSFTYKK